MPEITEQILFSGRVQGVGFRWTTERIVSSLPVCGFVRNLPDRRVEVVVTGSAVSIQQLIDGLQKHFGSGITGLNRQIIDAPEDFQNFEIRR
jgi:acylphosphatase